MQYRVTVRSPLTVAIASLCAVSLIAQQLGILSPHALAFLPPRYWHSALDCTRVFTWIISHAGWSHLMGNLPTLLLLGPGLERRLGVKRFAVVLLAVAACGAACHSVTSPNEGLQGLSGCVFAMLMLAGGAQLERSKLATGASEVSVPLSYVLLALLFSLQELSGWWSGPRTIARLAHFVGGVIGIAAAVWLGDGRLGPGTGHNPFE
ncbi:hypothetical protein FNF27_07954 [Cafeteria roenbergensis]|uniref:Peptidase S54 rhomboid domain-containing protein n=3 Tax=Cafeteria roenbergensis TaxID=33653 RepID=A0A5A8DDZ9_CAFRO|nr:hypothetical protein FNF29_07200 [Cafeteria roenbergensis]KAA0153231.1 hypothetical protein FNF28_06965 [Cafeteria roenbergensis]KAA0163249.1 hypothetical protein FNF27_07954 [Cafeteria roenbergensis]|eukprot:KAA0147645.1 hypothetical protein FNF29_07200 [Cafeteria roenbergensis]